MIIKAIITLLLPLFLPESIVLAGETINCFVHKIHDGGTITVSDYTGKWHGYKKYSKEHKKGLWRRHEVVKPWALATNLKKSNSSLTVERNLTVRKSTPAHITKITQKNIHRSMVNRSKTTINAYEYRPYSYKNKHVYKIKRKR